MAKILFLLLSLINVFALEMNDADFNIADIEQTGSTAKITINHDFKSPVKFKFIPSISCQETFPLYCRGKVVSVVGDDNSLSDGEHVLQVNFAELFGYASDVQVEIEAADDFFFIEF